MSFAAMSEDGADRVHVPVMAAEAEEILSAPSPSQIVDVTLGAAGHAARLLEGSPRAKLLGVDQDAAAIDVARHSLAKFDDRVTLVQANFADISSVMRDEASQARMRYSRISA